jgi:UDP-N-acetylglucosamine--N-acetylmuramyl-(pentapeptide) pyrophosphoryl-undecaprenol N-acetylglucosamine transferase
MGLATGDFLWIGTRGEVEETLVPRADLRLETISGGPIVGVPWRVRAANAARLIGSLGRVNRLFGEFRPKALFMTGGYVNVPVALTAWLRRVPAMIYLPDIEPGTAIKTLSRLARRVACTSAASQRYFPAGKVVVTGYPVRPELRAAEQLSRESALAHFELTPDRPTLFVFGGSRGARSINRAVMASLPELLSQMQVIHISGTLDWPEVADHAAGLPAEQQLHYRPYAYLHEEMGLAFRAADLVLARAGASMLGESPAFGLPSILVPYPYAWRYQKVNADYLVERGAAVRLDDEKLGERLPPTVFELINDKQRLLEMKAAAKRIDMPEAARNLARAIKELA